MNEPASVQQSEAGHRKDGACQSDNISTAALNGAQRDASSTPDAHHEHNNRLTSEQGRVMRESAVDLSLATVLCETRGEAITSVIMSAAHKNKQHVTRERIASQLCGYST